jgi:hypothetical protein
VQFLQEHVAGIIAFGTQPQQPDRRHSLRFGLLRDSVELIAR